MKFRIIPLGKGKPDPRSFGFQYLKHLKTLYFRLYFFAFYLALGSVDVAADYERIKNEQMTKPLPHARLNRKARRTLASIARRHA